MTEVGISGRADDQPIAIVGMAGIYPKAEDVTAFWNNILDGVDAVGDAPPDWGAELFYDSASSANDRIYTKRGGFLRELAVFDPLKHGVMPSSIDGGEPDQFLALEVAARAVEDAGFDQRPVPGDRVAVILGRGTYINRGFTTVVQHGLMVDRVLEVLRRLHPDTSEEELGEIKTALKSSLPPFNAEMSPALVPNLVTGRIANRLDFRGTNYIIDAACASSLIALERGVADLRAGRCDMAIVGGVHASTPPPIFMIFCQLEALSRAGRIRPFSAEADGTVLAEGVGLLCIKRLADAEAAGDRIYALVRSVGVASDGRGAGILAPRLEGETLALSRAYGEAGVAPESVGLIEAHGTATTVGDATEIKALAQQFGRRHGAMPSCALGSVKSMIGHCLPAAGSAGLIKAAMALHHKVLPPTLVDTPNPELGIDDTPFFLNTEARPWVHGKPTPRRAGVNAFGFGGINAHAILEEYRGGPEPLPVVRRQSEVIFLDAEGAAQLSSRISGAKARLEARDGPFGAAAAELSAELGDGGWRIAVVASDAADAIAKLSKAEDQVAKGKTRIRDRKGLYLGTEPLGRDGKVAFMFPGEGSQHVGMLRELMLHFPQMRRWFDLVDAAFADSGRDILPSQAVFPPPVANGSDDGMWRMDVGPEAIFAANQAMHALFTQLGLAPDMLVGHSTGEYSALYAAGSTRRDSVAALQREIRALNEVYQRLAAEGAVAEGRLIALGAVDDAALRARLEEREDVWLAMDNCPNQKVLATTSADGAAWAEATVATLGGFAEVLPFHRAYHCPAFSKFSEGLKELLDSLDVAPPELPVYSCMTAAPFPDDPARIRAMMAEQWSARVRFVDTIERMYADGARIFVECGPRNNLVAFTDDILRGRPHAGIAADAPARRGLSQLQHAMAQLMVEGVPFDVAALADPAPVTRQARKAGRPQVLKTGIQPMTLDALPPRSRGRGNAATDGDRTPAAPARSQSPAPRPAPAPNDLDGPSAPAVSAPSGGSALVDSYFQTMQQFLAVEHDVLGAYLGSRTAGGADPHAAVAAARYPLLTGIERDVDGSGLTAAVHVSAELWPFLDDHSFGRGISQTDLGLSGLRVVPLTFSIEVLAEAAAALCPELTVVALSEVRASRWLALDRPERRYEARAELLATGPVTRIRVRLREAGGPVLRPIVIEGEVELAETAPPAPARRPMALGAVRPAAWSSEDVYSRIMFHGPRLQAVDSVATFGETGAEGRLVGLPQNGLVAGAPDPVFQTDAVTLDALGQVVGVWAAEMLPDRFHIFPFRAERIEIFRRPLSTGESVTCSAEIALMANDEMRSDVDVISDDGHLQCRVTGWWDKRFDLPERFFRARLDPVRGTVARRFDSWGGAAPPGLEVALLDDLSDELLTSSGGIWAGVLAGLVLDARERAEWDGLRETAKAKRQMDWLRGRVAAKDAVRMLCGMPMRAADIGIVRSDPEGPPTAVSGLAELRGGVPHVTISHTSGISAGAAADPGRYAGVGVDVERVAPRSEAFLAVAFAPEERSVLQKVPAGPARDMLAARLWCAKEAAAKAVGTGLADLQTRFVTAVDAGAGNAVTVRDSVAGARLNVWYCDSPLPEITMAVVTWAP